VHPDLDPQAAVAHLLRKLPAAAAVPYDFAEYQRRAAQAARRGSTRIAFAAALVIGVGCAAAWLRVGESLPRPPHAAIAPGAPDLTELSAGTRPRTGTAGMERWLASLPDEPGLVHVGNRAAVTGLEDRIAQVDDLLTAERTGRPQPARLLALQEVRTRLLGALVQVRYAEALADQSP
jgi:hypothetical protein